MTNLMKYFGGKRVVGYLCMFSPRQPRSGKRRKADEDADSQEDSRSSAMSEQTGRNPRVDGIRIEDALSILSTRSRMGGNRSVTADAVPREMKEMGQTIDMDQPSTDADRADPRGPLDGGGTASLPANPVVPETMSDDDRRKHDAMKAERERRGKEIQEHMRTMEVADLLKMIFQAQQERVAAYKMFDRSVLLSHRHIVVVMSRLVFQSPSSINTNWLFTWTLALFDTNAVDWIRCWCRGT